ncbi:MAG: glycosyltransferase [Bacteroidota bacterium]
MVNQTNRTRLGIFFTGSYNWIGGLYYVLNVVKTLNALPDRQKPELVILCSYNLPEEMIDKFEYPYIHKVLHYHSTKLEAGFIKGYKKLFKRDYRLEQLIDTYRLDAIFPCIEILAEVKPKHPCKLIGWIPDFQHHFLPDFFDEKEIEKRNKRYTGLAKRADYLVLSSHDAKGHYEQFYGKGAKAVPQVMNFISIVEVDNLPEEKVIREKYGLNGPYFMVANQFWQHKNHRVVLEAIKLLRDQGQEVVVAMSGRKVDNRAPGFFNTLQAYIDDHSLTDSLNFLGFMPREDQLAAMKYSVAVLQPSKFEGWSTVNEDAKVLNQFVICADLAVNREQMGDNSWYFDVNDAATLASYLVKLLNGEAAPTLEYPSREKRIEDFATDLMRMVAPVPVT